MADAWDEFQDAWDEFGDAPAASVPAGGRRGRGGVDVAAQRSQGRQQRDLRRQQVRDTFSMEHAPETSIAAGEQIAMLGSGAAAELAGLGTEVAARGRRLLGLAGANDPDPKTQRDQITERFTYQPRTPGAAEQLGEAVAPVARLLGPVVDAFGAEKRRFEGVPVLEDLYAAPFLAGEGLLAMGGQAGGQARSLLRTERAGREAVELADRQLTDPGLLAARYGLEVSPNELQAVRPGADVPGGAKFAESATNTVTAESRARANAPRLNRIAAREMGVPETDLLTPEVFQRAKEPHFAVRQEGKKFPQTPTSQEFMQDIGRLRSGEWDPDAARTIHEIVGRHEVLGSSDDLVDRITSLRDQASKRMRSDGQMAYKDYEVGTALRRLADAMEEELGRRAQAAGDVSYQGRLRESRRALAKIYSVEDATRADHLDVSRLTAAQQRGAPFSEDLAVLSHIGGRLPRSVEHTQKVPAAPTGVETSAAGPLGAVNRFTQNAIRRLIGGRVVDNFNEGLQQQAAGLDPTRVLPDAFRPRYDYPSPMGPNAGPSMPAPPPSAPPGLFADDIPMPRAPAAPDAGRPAPAGPSFNELLAEELLQQMPEAFPGPSINGPNMPAPRNVAPIEPWKRDLSVVGGDFDASDLRLEGELPPRATPPAPFSRPLDVVDFEPAQPPPPPGQALPALTQDQLRLAPEQPMTATDPVSGLPFPEPNSIAAMLDEPVSRRRRTPVGRGIEGDFASQLGAVSDPIMLPDAPGMPNRPRGVAGPRSAQLGGRTPRGFELLDDDTPPPLGPRFGPEDEFGGAPMPTAPPSSVADLIGTPPVADDLIGDLSLAPDAGPAAPRADVTESLPSQGSALFPDDFLLPGARRVEAPTGFVDLLETPDGALQIKRTKTAPGQEGRGFGQERLLNAAREAQAQGKPLNSDVEVNPDARRLYEKLREKGQLEFDGPFDDGGPVFRNIRPRGGDAQPAPAGVSDLLARYDKQDGGEFPWMSDDEFLRDLADTEELPPAVRSKVDEYLERREADYSEDAGRGDSDEFAEQTIEAVRRLLGG